MVVDGVTCGVLARWVVFGAVVAAGDPHPAATSPTARTTATATARFNAGILPPRARTGHYPQQVPTFIRLRPDPGRVSGPASADDHRVLRRRPTVVAGPPRFGFRPLSPVPVSTGAPAEPRVASLQPRPPTDRAHLAFPARAPFHLRTRRRLKLADPAGPAAALRSPIQRGDWRTALPDLESTSDDSTSDQGKAHEGGPPVEPSMHHAPATASPRGPIPDHPLPESSSATDSRPPRPARCSRVHRSVPERGNPGPRGASRRGRRIPGRQSGCEPERVVPPGPVLLPITGSTDPELHQ